MSCSRMAIKSLVVPFDLFLFLLYSLTLTLTPTFKNALLKETMEMYGGLPSFIARSFHPFTETNVSEGGQGLGLRLA